MPTRLLLAAALALGGSLTFAAHPVLALSAPTSFGFISSPGDYVGQGLNESWDTSNATITAGGNGGGVGMTVTTATDYWHVSFRPPAGQQLLPGDYPNALRAPVSGTSPGIYVSGNGRGCNNVYGSFTIYQLAFSSNGSLTQLDADFVQMCESPTAPPMTGIVRYQASPRSGVAISPSVSLSYPGEPVTLTGTALSLGAGTPTGTMTFFDGNIQIGAASLDPTGRASITAAFSSLGTHLITAVYSGDAAHIGGPSAQQSITVEGGSTTVTWYSFRSVAGDWVGQGATSSYGPAEASFGLRGSTTYGYFSVSAGAESWSVSLSAPAGQTLAPGTYGGGGFAPGLIGISGDGRGSESYGSVNIASIGWDAGGNLDMLDASFIASAGSNGQDPMVGVIKYAAPLPLTRTSLSVSSTTVNPGEATILTATVSTASAPAPTGSITFSAGSLVLGSAPVNSAGQAVLSTSFPVLGSPVVSATYPGDPAHASSTSAPVTLTVQNPTVTTLSGSPLQPKRGKPVTLTAKVTSQDGGIPMGTVTFTDNGKVLGTVALDPTGAGVLVVSLSSGNHPITAQYSGDATDQPSLSNAVVVAPH